MFSTEYRQTLSMAISALERELKAKNKQQAIQESKKIKGKRALASRDSNFLICAFNKKQIQDTQIEARQYILRLCRLRDPSLVHVPDQDRAILNEAILAMIDLKYIELLIKDYPRACEAGGCVDHINHPIHVACKNYRRAVPIILRTAPESASQRDENDRAPLELFLKNRSMIDISSEEFANTVNHLCNANPKSSRETFVRRQSLKQYVLMHGLLPSHLKNALDPEKQERLQGLHEKVHSVTRRLSIDL